MAQLKVGDRVRVAQDEVSWGWGTVEAVYHQKTGGPVTGVRVRRDAGTTMVVAPSDVKQ